MNAAARLVHQHALSRHLALTFLFKRQQFAIILLAVSVLLSALGVIYVTHANRMLHAAYQRNLLLQDNLHVERGQLLLERSTWMMQARIQQIAEKELMMMIPEHKSVVIIQE